MMICPPCQQAERQAKLEKLLQDARDWAKKEGIIEAVILEGPNGHRYYCAADDERAQRLTIVEHVSGV